MSRREKKRQDDQEESDSPAEPTPSLLKYNIDLHYTDPENKAPVRLARDLYFKEYTYEYIFLSTGVPPSVFRSRCKKWSKVKERVDVKLIENIRKKAVSAQTKEYIEKGLQVGLKFIDRLLKREAEITPKDWKLVSDSIMALHRVHQLETGKPTDISVYEKMSPSEIQAYLLEMQKQVADKHDMSMFAPGDDIPEEELLEEYNRGNTERLN